jgi:hypothetical protein
MRAKISELSTVTGLPSQICWPWPELRDRLRFTAVSSISILQAFAWAGIVGSVRVIRVDRDGGTLAAGSSPRVRRRPCPRLGPAPRASGRCWLLGPRVHTQRVTAAGQNGERSIFELEGQMRRVMGG